MSNAYRFFLAFLLSWSFTWYISNIFYGIDSGSFIAGTSILIDFLWGTYIIPIVISLILASILYPLYKASTSNHSFKKTNTYLIIFGLVGCAISVVLLLTYFMAAGWIQRSY